MVSPDDEEQLVGEAGSGAPRRGEEPPVLRPRAALSADVDHIDDVAEVSPCPDLSSAGIDLNSADFILTLASVHVKEARHELSEDFCPGGEDPASTGGVPRRTATSHATIAGPAPPVARVDSGSKRGALQTRDTRRCGDVTRRPRGGVRRRCSDESSSAALLASSEARARHHQLGRSSCVMVAVKRAGYRSGDMLTSKNNFLYCYLFFLIGRHEYRGSAERGAAGGRSPAGSCAAPPPGGYYAEAQGRSSMPDSACMGSLMPSPPTRHLCRSRPGRSIDTQLTSDFWNT